MSATFQIIGNLVADPELREVGAGKAVVNFAIAVSSTRPDGTRTDPSFFNCTAWEDLAVNVASSLSKGQRVAVTGRMKQDRWEAEDGSKRSAIKFTAEEVAASLRWATVEIHKVAKADATDNGVSEGENEADLFVS